MKSFLEKLENNKNSNEKELPNFKKLKRVINKSNS